MKKIYAFLTLLACLLCAPGVARAQIAAPGQWRIHNSFDYYFDSFTPGNGRMFCLPLGVGVSPFGAQNPAYLGTKGQLFVIDEATNEIEAYNKGNYLNGNVISRMAYNYAKGYLLIVYTDYNIDLLYDDDTVFAIPGLASANVQGSKNVNNITFDPQNSRAYVATDFGYFVIDDNKKVISESRTYPDGLKGIGRMGDRLLAAKADGIYTSPLSDRHTTFASFTKIPEITLSGSNPFVLPMTDNIIAYPGAGGIWTATFGADGTVTTANRVGGAAPTQYSYVRDGYILQQNDYCGLFDNAGTYQSQVRVSNIDGIKGMPFGTADGRTFYSFIARNGFRKATYDPDTKTATIVNEYIPNAPMPYMVFNFDYSPSHGMLHCDNVSNRFINSDGLNPRILTSGYKDGQWTNYGGPVSSSPMANNMRTTWGLAIDPLDDNIMWQAALRTGLYSIDLRDNSIKNYGYAGSPVSNMAGFNAVFRPGNQYSYCNVAVPTFDAQGNMWVTGDASSGSLLASPLYLWTAADRQAGNVSGFKAVPVPGFDVKGGTTRPLACKNAKNFGKVVMGIATLYEGPLYLYSAGRDINDFTDDASYTLNKFVDQDGNASSFVYFNCLFEDPLGRVWVGHSTGVFYFEPSEVTSSGTLRIHRVKVAREDGTQLADYLLDGADVTGIAADGAGRLWFATAGNGIVVTSPDGMTIVDQFTTQNSLLPNDVVYGLGFDPSSNAVWIGTNGPTATYYCDATTPGTDYKEALAFPNPVRPEYLGDVTIRGLMDASLVKIVDAGGTLVKDLGISNGGMAIWDLTDMNGHRVHTGVYYITASTTGTDGSHGHVGKILVVR